MVVKFADVEVDDLLRHPDQPCLVLVVVGKNHDAGWIWLSRHAYPMSRGVFDAKGYEKVC
jgi:hypothetical protein